MQTTTQQPSQLEVNPLLRDLKNSKGYKAHTNRPVNEPQASQQDQSATLLPGDTNSAVGPVSGALNGTTSEFLEEPLPSDPVDQELFVDWKKRYDDSRTFINKLQEDKKALESKLTSSDKSIPLPESEDEVDSWKEENPELFAKITTIIKKENKPLEEALARKELQEANAKLFNEVKEGHRDAGEIRQSEVFRDWFEEQTPATRALIESRDARDIVRGIQLFKQDVNWKQPQAQVQPNGKTAEDASVVMTKGTAGFTPSSQKKIWSDAEVRAMSSKDFTKHQVEINQAKREGRYQFG
jgi:D-ribose pyranose/furanose isomerase RbsD